MAKADSLGQFEQLVLTAILALHDDAYGVTIHAKVVKYSPGIMGKNWVHLRDGTGSAEKNDHDLTVTTQDETKVGDVVTVKGTVQVDKDFGAGYAYPVIVEDAKLVK